MRTTVHGVNLLSPGHCWHMQILWLLQALATSKVRGYKRTTCLEMSAEAVQPSA